VQIGSETWSKVAVTSHNFVCHPSTPFVPQFWNGTPFSCALADGLIDPRRTIQIGIRGPMSPGKMLSEEAGMRVVDMEEFYDLGPKTVAQEARQVRTAAAGPNQLVSWHTGGMHQLR
jgi:arginase family enzyme